jgi:N4-gp56 family major capsid protein
MLASSYFDDATKKIASKANVYPLVVVGDEAVKAITLHANRSQGKGRFEIIVKKPGVQTADFHDPFGKKGFYSIQWWSGLLVQRAERIAVLHVDATK